MRTNEKEKKDGFFKRVKQEFKKIIWPTKNRVAKQTALVVVAVVVLGILASLLDKGVSLLMGVIA